jgi:putative ABC transport system permease protein
MNLRTLARRSLRHYFRAHLGVLAGATLAAAVLIGALAVGDSVKGSLK